MVSKQKTGFTIIELLIGVSIVAALTAITLPAIQASRESARLTSCRNNVTQLSKAMIQFEGYYGYYPSGGWSSGWLGVADRAGDSAQPGGWAFSVLPYMEEMATRNIVANVPASQAAAAYTKLVTTPVSGFNCPTRRVAQPIATTATTFQTASGPISVTKATRSDYAMNSGSKGSCPDLEDFASIIAAAGKLSGSSKKVTICHAPPGNPTNDVTMTIALMGLSGHQHHDEDRMGACDTCDDPVVASTPTSLSEGDGWRKMSAAQKLVTLDDMGIPDVQNGMTSRMSRLKAAHASDGLSNTYLVGEKYVASQTYFSGSDAGDKGPMMAGYSGDNVRWAFSPPAMDTRSSATSTAVAFGSGHRAGWNMAYADGMVRTISFSIEPTLHAQLAGRNDGPGVIAIPPK